MSFHPLMVYDRREFQKSERKIADEGPAIKRFRPRAQGRAFPIHKPMTHITIVVADQEA